MERITPEQAFAVGLRAVQALSVAKAEKGVVQRALGDSRFGEALVNVIQHGSEEVLRRLGVDALVPPIHLDSLFEMQIAKFMSEPQFANEAGMDQGEFKGALESVAEAFEWSPGLAKIGLGRVYLIPCGLPLPFLVNVAKVANYLDLSMVRNFDGVVTPTSGVLAIQCQLGEGCLNRIPTECRTEFGASKFVQGLTVPERLVAHYLDPLALAMANTDIVGSVSASGSVPYLTWHDGRALLYAYWHDSANPRFGSASRGS